jgi:hypothetical protein
MVWTCRLDEDITNEYRIFVEIGNLESTNGRIIFKYVLDKYILML